MQVRYQLRQRPGSGDPTTRRIPDESRIGATITAVRTIRPVTQTTSPLAHLDDHLRRVAEDGYTILPDAIEPELVEEIDDALLKLERDLGVVPADNLFEGVHTTRV